MDHTASVNRRRLRGATRWLVATGALAVTAAVAVVPAAASTGSVTLSAGSLAFVSAPGNVTFPATTLNGTNQTKTATLAIDVSDATGSGAGWNVTATSTTFTGGCTGTGCTAPTLPTTATTVQSTPTVACDSGATCTVAAPTTAVSYPYTLPAAATAPTATKLYNAGANSGMGNQTVTPTFTLAIPANQLIGNGSAFTSTWTVSLVSGP
jgi:hypothetical protein